MKLKVNCQAHFVENIANKVFKMHGIQNIIDDML